MAENQHDRRFKSYTIWGILDEYKIKLTMMFYGNSLKPVTQLGFVWGGGAGGVIHNYTYTNCIAHHRIMLC